MYVKIVRFGAVDEKEVLTKDIVSHITAGNFP
jgi:hypothetical protein